LENNIKTDLRETWMKEVAWINLPQDRDRRRAGFCGDGNEPSGSIKGEEYLD
jgi:hypothetical protein